MNLRYLAGLTVIFLLLAASAHAHFQMVIPDRVIIGQADGRSIHLDLLFAHPFNGGVMDMALPVQFGVLVGGKKTDLKPSLTPKSFKNSKGFTLDYTVKRPGDHIFYVEPAPYFEAAEDTLIVQYTKVVINALGLEKGWEKEVGFKAEIVPLARPYGLWTGNLFRGIVKFNGKPAPFTAVNIEYYNQNAKVKAPAAPFGSQVVVTDKNGVFAYAMPKAGWWGFAALRDGGKQTYNGKPTSVELGAVMWVQVQDMK